MAVVDGVAVAVGVAVGVGDGVPNAAAMQSAYLLALLYCDDGRWDDAEQCLAYGAEVPEPVFFLLETLLGLVGRARLMAHRGELTGNRLARARRGPEGRRRAGRRLAGRGAPAL